MAFPPRHRSRATGSGTPTRRRVLGAGLVAGAAAALSGCGVRVGSPSAQVTPVPPGPDELARERVARDADSLRALAVRAAALVPADRRLLAAVAADHRAHATALRPGGSSGTSSGPSASAASASASGSVPGSRPLTARTALPTLVRAERAAAAAASTELDRVGGDVARLLASVAASRSLHVRALTARVQAEAVAP